VVHFVAQHSLLQLKQRWCESRQLNIFVYAFQMEKEWERERESIWISQPVAIFMCRMCWHLRWVFDESKYILPPMAAYKSWHATRRTCWDKNWILLPSFLFFLLSFYSHSQWALLAAFINIYDMTASHSTAVPRFNWYVWDWETLTHTLIHTETLTYAHTCRKNRHCTVVTLMLKLIESG